MFMNTAPGPHLPLDLLMVPQPTLLGGCSAPGVRAEVYTVLNTGGYSPKKQSWMPACHFLDKTLIRDFHRTRPDQPDGLSGAIP